MTTNPEYDHSTDASTVAAAFPDAVKDKVILITGVNAGGIGGATAKALATQSPKLLILSGRSAEKVDAVISEIHKSFPNVQCRFLQMDLSSINSVRKAGSEVMTYKEDINILINNAGVMAIPDLTLSTDGIEMQFATNHIGHFLFTNLILAKLIKASKASPTGSVRIVNVSSMGHSFGPVRFSDINFTKLPDQLPESERPNIELLKTLGFISESEPTTPYDQFTAYAQSKSANILFSVSLAQKLAAHGIQSFALHPGAIGTEISRHLDEEWVSEVSKSLPMVMKTLDQGASTTLVAALDPALKVDQTKIYLEDCQLKDAAPYATDKKLAEKLWELSENLVGQKFTIA
jgi:NAD(P)-dependent dehydrogenase (short-subunit alcohol dehydrogenase family)